MLLHFTLMQGRILGGGLWGPGPAGVTKGAPKRKKKGKEKRKRGEKGGKQRKRCEKRRRKREQERKKKERKVNQIDERAAMQFQVQVGAPGKKTSGVLN